MATGGVHVRVDGECTRVAQLGRDLVRVDIGDERGLDWRRDGGRRFEAELHLPSARHERRGRGWGRCGEVLVGRRQSGHEAPELQVPEELEHGGTVVRRPASALELERHREVGDDRRELATAQHLILVRGERFA